MRTCVLSQLAEQLESWTRKVYPLPGTDSRRRSSLTSIASLSDYKKCRISDDRKEWNDGIFDIEGDDGVDWTDTDSEGMPMALRRDSIVSRASGDGSSKSIWYDDDGLKEWFSTNGFEDPMFDREQITGHGPIVNELREILKSYYIMVLRLSIDCPFKDVRRTCRYILSKLQSMGASVPSEINSGPSWLIPVTETIAFKDDSTGRTIDGAPSPREEALEVQFSLPWKPAVSKESSTESERHQSNLYIKERDEQEADYFSLQVASPKDDNILPVTPAIPIATPRLFGTARIIGSDDIDQILLDPERRDNIRRARFSLDATSLSDRPILGRKRRLSLLGSCTQRRANASLQAYHISRYMKTGRISNYAKMVSYFPRYYEAAFELHDSLIGKQGGPLQRITKYYIAVLAAAQSNCQYFVSYFTYKFLQLGEHSEWLIGLSYAPRKLQRLGKIGAILAQQPWRFSSGDVGDLLVRSRTSIESGEHVSDQWTMSELVEALCILSLVIHQSQFVLATGVVLEADNFGGASMRRRRAQKATCASVDVFPLYWSYDSRKFASPSSLIKPDPQSARDEDYSLSSLMIIPGTSSRNLNEIRSPASNDESNEDTIPTLLRKRRQSIAELRSQEVEDPEGDGASIVREPRRQAFFESCGQVCLSAAQQDYSDLSASAPSAYNLLKTSSGPNACSSNSSLVSILDRHYETAGDMPVNPILEDMTRFSSHDVHVSYEDFDLSSQEYAVLRLSDYNWEDHACSLIGRFLPGLEENFDRNFQEALDAAGDEDEGFFFGDDGTIDQRPLREAVWYFVLRLCGIMNDGYDYKEINLLLTSRTKRYLKKICTHPELISRQDWQKIGKGLRSQEKVLLALLATEAKLMATIVYAMKAVSLNL